MAAPIKQFCPQGHDTFIFGRAKNGQCNGCKRPVSLGLKTPISRKTQFCPKGHDKDIVGRTKDGYCRECSKLKQRKDPTKDSRIKQFCPKGHDTFAVGRDKYNGCCIECQRLAEKEFGKKFYEENKDAISARNKEYRGEHKEELKLKSKEWRDKNKEILKLRNRKRYEKNKKQILERNKQWAKENPEKVITMRKRWEKAHRNVIKASKIKTKINRKLRVPLWADWNKIIEFYDKMPDDMVGDHYIPLQGDEVSGLHVSWNLQYLTPHDNTIKYNKANLVEISKWYGKILEQAGLK
jgi:hypothetical protein